MNENESKISPCKNCSILQLFCTISKLKGKKERQQRYKEKKAKSIKIEKIACVCV
jgi:hypothetical protein